MPMTKRIDVVGQALVDLLEANWVEAAPDGSNVYYGEQRLVPEFPAIVVESLPKDRSYATTRQYEIVFGFSILVLWGKVDSDAETNRKELDAKVESIEDVLQANQEARTLNGLVYTSYVRRIEPRVSLRGAPKIKASRLTWLGESREVMS